MEVGSEEEKRTRPERAVGVERRRGRSNLPLVLGEEKKERKKFL